MSKPDWLIKATVRQVALQARGPAVAIANGMIEQVLQFLSAGMPFQMALREALLLAIQLAQLRTRHCVDIERFALDDFIRTCLEMEIRIGQCANI